MPVLMFVSMLVFLSALLSASTVLAQTGGSASTTAPVNTGTRYFAVTLLSSFEPIPDALLPTELKTHRVYRTQSVVFGKIFYFVRLGFFASAAQATAMRDGLTTLYPSAFVSEVMEKEFAAVASIANRKAQPQASATPPPTDIYVVTLGASETAAPALAGPLPIELKNKRIYRHDRSVGGGPRHSLQLGFFTTAAEALTAKKLLLALYPQASVRQASAREREGSDRTVVAIPATATASTPQSAKAVLPLAGVYAGVDSQADDLLARARAALTRADNSSAIQLLTQLLQLPPNRHSQEAQELIGLAHERNGEIAKAKREYALCLALYPDWSGAERVRQRLADLDTAPTTKTLRAVKRKETSVSTAYGSLSQYYYRGNSRVDTTDTPLVGPPQSFPTLTGLNQSQLITTVDLTGRFRSGDFDNRVVVLDRHTLNFLPNTENTNRLYSAYAEVRNKLQDYAGRLGRQPGNSGGVLGRFDGISLGYSVLPKWRINVVAGEPVEFNPINSDRQFWGASLDMGTFAERWNGNAYYISQTVDGILDRQALGTELRYFDPRRSLLSLLDYDVSYGALNIALLQGTWQVASKSTLNLLIDHRKAPVLQTSNAVFGEVDTSIGSHLLTLTEEQLRIRAEARTPISRLIMLGATHNFSPTWQLGGDIKRYNISGTPASGTLLSTPGTGNIYVYTMQGIATGLLSKRDVSVLGLSYFASETYDGESIVFNNRALFQEKWTIDVALLYYQQKDNAGTDTNRLTPTIRIGYQWRDKITFEVELGREKTESVGSTSTDKVTRNFYSLGYRWDF